MDNNGKKVSLNQLNKNSFESFDQLVGKIRSDVKTQRNRGTEFEYMTKVYLEQSYPETFRHVWMLKEVPAWTGIPHKDLGVDLVCQDKINPKKFVAVQCKFYLDSHTVSKNDTNSFVSQLGKKYYSSGIWVSSTSSWNSNAEDSLENTSKPISRIGLSDLRNANINWAKFDKIHLDNNFKKDLRKSHGKHLRNYQNKAVNNAVKYYRKAYRNHDDHYRRGKLIMAPGTGKTYTSLNISEALQKDQHSKYPFYVLYLVPSIQLLSQTLFSWNRDVNDDTTMIKFAVTSDRNATKFHRAKHADISSVDIGFPATTSADELMRNYSSSVTYNTDKKRMFVIFSTYQSIDVIHQIQQMGFPKFNLIICDEAHRTAGHYRSRKTEGIFTRVLHNDYVKSDLRLFQTATPKIYGENARRKGKDNNVVLASMDNPKLYGKTFYYLSFGDAVKRRILTDYKVLVLTVDEDYIHKNISSAYMDGSNGILMDDVGKIIGTWNALLKRKSFSNESWGKPMKRAIAFAQVIDNQRTKSSHGKIGSMQIAREFNNVMQDYLGNKYDDSYHVDIRHADGSMNAMQKKDALDWLRADVPENHAKILSNVKFLGEGVDVPSLDAVIFYAPKQSQIEIVQAVGRIMRKFHGKDYGYVILPIVIPYGKDPKRVLDKNKTYKSVWQVLNALRSVDDRFNAEVNKLNFKSYKSKRIIITGVGDKPKDKAQQLNLPLWKSIYDAIRGEIVKKVGDRRYLEQWTGDIAKIAQRHIRWINLKLKGPNSSFTNKFNAYLKSLRININDDITKSQAVEMLAQHIITKPVFESLFKNSNFVENNPVSKAMQGIVKAMEKVGFQGEQAKLDGFYKQVEDMTSGVNGAKDKQDLIRFLYGTFFSKAFAKTTDRLGIVFTPVPVVNFIIHSVDYALHKYFGKSIASTGVHILDPFVGTGTFITQTLYYLAYLHEQDKISIADIVYKYTNELHCNEIVLLSYYIAAINIESVFNEIVHNKQYQEFKGVVLTDTFESTERTNTLDDDIFGENNDRLKEENKAPIRVIMSNPPYRSKQKNQNDDAQNERYPKLDNKIKNSYVKNSQSILTRNYLYDSYIKAMRWSSDRINKKGIVGLVTNGIYITSKDYDGLRKCLHDEFNYLYIYNLRGNQHTSGEQSRREGGKIFGSHSRTPIAISIMIKDGSQNHKIFYKDIGDFLSRDYKFKILSNKNSIGKLNWEVINPDKYNDWINRRNQNYQKLIPMHKSNQNSIFPYNSLGVTTNRDAWVYGFSKSNVLKNVNRLIKNYNLERTRLLGKTRSEQHDLLNRSQKFVKWSNKLERYLYHNDKIKLHRNHMRLSLYRPFTKKWLYYDNQLNEAARRYYRKCFGDNNLVIATSGRGSQRGISTLCTNEIPELGIISASQGFMRYNNEKDNNGLIKTRHDNINPQFAKKLGLSTDDAFYYIYGILNSPEYQNKYKNDLKKDLARIPIVKNVAPFVKIGHKLMDLHVNYEHVAPYKDVKIEYSSDHPSYHVTRMEHGTYHGDKSNDPRYKHLKYIGRESADLTTIIYNGDITIKNIPLKAYNYVVNNKAAIDWILDQYQIIGGKNGRKKKKYNEAGIVDDPNKFKGGKYIFDLLLRIINVSIQSVDLINKLPKMQIDVNDQKLN